MRRLDRYQLGDEIGVGASARVCRAFDPELRRAVAVKIMHPHLRGNGPAAERFRREAQSVAALEHPNVVRIYDVAPAGDDELYFVAELMEGGTVADWLAAEPGQRLPHEIALAVLLQVLRGLEAAHKAGVVHRDLKPENLMLSADGFVKVADFGIARLSDQRSELTQTGGLVGSPAYMAPEQIEGRPIDARADLFAAGVVFYRLVTGRLPFGDGNVVQTLQRIAAGEHTPVRELEPTLDPRLAAFIERCLAVDPAGRPASAHDAREALAPVAQARRLGDPAEEIQAHRAGDEESRRRRSYAVVESLVAEAKALLEVGRDPALAMALIDRALEIQPFHFEAYRLLQRTGGAGKKRKLLWFAGGLAVIAILLLGGWWLATSLEPSDPAAAPAVERALVIAPVAPAPAPAPAAEPAPAERAPAPAPEPKAAPKTAAAKPQAGFGTLHLITRPWADVYLDGSDEKLGTTPVLQDISLRAGKHTLKLVNPHAHFVEITVDVEAGEKVQKVVELPLLPGLLQIVASTDDVVLLNGEPVRPDRLREPLQLPHGDHTITFVRGAVERKVEVEVIAGRMVETRSPFLVPPVVP